MPILIALVLAIYGFYVASHVPALASGPPVPLLLAGFALQAVCAFAGAYGAWRGTRWASNAVILLGIAVAATWLVEALVLGIVADLSALAVAIVAVLVSLGFAAYLKRHIAP